MAANTRTDPADRVTTLAVDIGGSGIKALLLDEAGQPLSTRGRVETPKPATPKAVIAVIAMIAEIEDPKC